MQSRRFGQVGKMGERKCEALRSFEYSGGWITQGLPCCDESNNSNMSLVELALQLNYSEGVVNMKKNSSEGICCSVHIFFKKITPSAFSVDHKGKTPPTCPGTEFILYLWRFKSLIVFVCFAHSNLLYYLIFVSSFIICTLDITLHEVLPRLSELFKVLRTVPNLVKCFVIIYYYHY